MTFFLIHGLSDASTTPAYTHTHTHTHRQTHDLRGGEWAHHQPTAYVFDDGPLDGVVEELVTLGRNPVPTNEDTAQHRCVCVCVCCPFM